MKKLFLSVFMFFMLLACTKEEPIHSEAEYRIGEITHYYADMSNFRTPEQARQLLTALTKMHQWYAYHETGEPDAIICNVVDSSFLWIDQGHACVRINSQLYSVSWTEDFTGNIPNDSAHIQYQEVSTCRC